MTMPASLTLSPAQESRLMKVFNAIDVNHDKFLDKKALCPEYPVEFVFFPFRVFHPRRSRLAVF